MRFPSFLSALLLAAAPALAGPLSITDSQGTQEFETAPKQVVVANWGLAEVLLDLGITPVGVADINGYRKWVSTPALPASVQDIGVRGEPSIEAILALKPDLFILADDEKPFIGRSRKVAPTLYFKIFSKGHDNVAASRAAYLELAKLFERTPRARAQLADMDARLADLRGQIAARYDGTPPKVTVVRMIDAKRVAIYGQNSPVQAALDALGLEPAVKISNSRWGLATKAVRKLGQVDEGKVMTIMPFDEASKLYDSALWKAMPFVETGDYHELPTLWTYGGPLSVGRIGDAIAAELLQ